MLLMQPFILKHQWFVAYSCSFSQPPAATQRPTHQVLRRDLAAHLCGGTQGVESLVNPLGDVSPGGCNLDYMENYGWFMVVGQQSDVFLGAC